MLTDAVGGAAHFAFRVFFQFEDESDFIIRIARRDVKVEMENGLSGDPSIVCKQIVSLQRKRFDQRPGDGLRRIENRVICVVGQFQEIFAVPLGDDEGMPIVDRVDIEDRGGMVVLEKELCRDLPSQDLAENAVIHREPIY